jgi:hypothetical protein
MWNLIDARKKFLSLQEKQFAMRRQEEFLSDQEKQLAMVLHKPFIS